MENRQDSMQNITKQLRVVFRAVQSHSKTVQQQCGLSSAKLWMMWELVCQPRRQGFRTCQGLDHSPVNMQ